MKLAFLALSALAAAAGADLATQSNWAGGPGVPGPVISWGDDFSIDTSMNWFSTPGLLKLAGGAPTDIEEGSYGMAVADIDGDGDLDLAAACYSAGKIVWWENSESSGKRWTEHSVQTGFPAPQAIACADIDDDGDSDIACSSMQTPNLSWWENDGTGQVWTAHLIDNSMGIATSLGAGDINGDGAVDLAGCVHNGSDVLWWRNTASGILWSRFVVDNSFEGAWSVDCADVDGDGVLDIVACGSGTWAKPVAWWDNAEGSGMIWQEHTIDLRFNGARSVTSADIDGDGDLDVAAAAMYANEVAWWENANGSGASWVKHTVDGSMTGAASILVTDLDGNGFADIAAASQAAADVYWYGNIGGSGESWEKNILATNQAGATAMAVGDVDGNGSGELFTGGSSLSILWDFDDNMAEGALESSILDTQCDPDWGLMLWSAYTPAGTQVTFRFRSSDDPAAMGDWSDTMVSPGQLGSFVQDGDRYFQYRVRFSSSDVLLTPVLNDLTVSWEPMLGSEGGEAPAAFVLMPVSPNPVSGAVTIEFALPEPAQAAFSIFDLSGRLVRTTGASGFDPGWHSLQMGTLPPGVHFVRMEAGGFTAVERFVVLE